MIPPREARGYSLTTSEIDDCPNTPNDYYNLGISTYNRKRDFSLQRVCVSIEVTEERLSIEINT